MIPMSSVWRNGTWINVNNRKLLNSTECNDLLTIKSLVEIKNVDINYVDERGFSALHCAAAFGFSELVEYLVLKGSKLDEIGTNPISISAGNFERPHTPLYWAISEGHTEVAEVLIKHGARADIQNESGHSILDAAISSRKSELIDLVQNHSCFDIDEYHSETGYTPLLRAFKWDSINSARYLLKKGANYRKHSEPDGLSALHCAISGMELLYEAPLAPIKLLLDHIGRKEGEEKMIEYINYQCTKWGHTALHFACSQTDYPVIKFLIHCGADPNIKDKKGWTPLDRVDYGTYFSKRRHQRIKSIFDSVAHIGKQRIQRS